MNKNKTIKHKFKAKVKETGEIIEVIETWQKDWYSTNWTIYYADDLEFINVIKLNIMKHFNINKINISIDFLNPFDNAEAKIELFNIYSSKKFKYFMIEIFNFSLCVNWGS